MKIISRKIISLLLSIILIVSAFSCSVIVRAVNNIITYTFSGNNSEDKGYAEGTITLIADDGTYWLYWADDNGALEGYSKIACLTVSATASHTMYPQTAIPVDATKVIAIKCATEPTDKSIDENTIVYNLPNTKLWNIDKSDIKYTFASYSDIHIDNHGSTYAYDDEHWSAALDTATKRDVDFIITSGDNINNNCDITGIYKKEWQKYLKILAESDYCNPIYESIGNHELWQGVDVGTEYFINSTGLEGDNNTSNNAYFTKDICGDHFIFMSLEGGFYPSLVEEFSTEQLDWLEGLLKEYSGDGKNIYIVEHSLFYNYGAGDKTDGEPYYDIPLSDEFESTKRFKSILQEYKDTIFISGHTHISFDAQLNYSTNNDTSAQMVHNSSVGGIRKVVNNALDRNYLLDETEGYIVDVYDEAIIFNGANLYYNQYNPNCCYIVNTSQQAYNKMTSTDPTTSPTTESTTAIATTDLVSDIYVKGSFNSWGTDNPLNYTSSSNIYMTTIQLNAGTYKFKINQGSTWYGNTGKIEDTTKLTSNGGWVMNTSAGDCTLVASGGYYTFNFNTSNNKLNVLYSQNDPTVTEPSESTEQLNDEYAKRLYTVVGNAGLCGTEWDVDNTENDMIYVGDGIYEKTFTGFTTGWYEFAVVQNRNIEIKYGAGNTAENFYTGLNGYDTVTVTFDAKTNYLTYRVDFAEEYPYTLGDVNEDNNINIKDATYIQRYTVGIIEDLTYAQQNAADVNIDGNVDVIDVTLIQKYIAKLVNNLGDENVVSAYSTTNLEDVLTDVKCNLDLYYRYSSYDSYQQLKKNYRSIKYMYDNNSLVDEDVAVETLTTLLDKLLAIVDVDNIDSDSSEITVYFENTLNWSNVYVYCWTDSVNNGTWPGQKATYVGINSVNNKSIYSYTLDTDFYSNIIFSNGNGKQTSDIALTDGNICYYLTTLSNGKYLTGVYNIEDINIT